MARQLETILDHIAVASPQGAGHVLDRLDEMTSMVAAQPGIGRSTSRLGFRRIQFAPAFYAIIDRVSDNEVVVHSIRHSARKPQHSRATR